ncbi:MAG: hypothetical protein MJ082_05330, partial [Clostridia bacterium]|nr:hypothetical protein [Clostridia bacterium]
DALIERAGRGTFDLSPQLMKRWTGANLLWFAATTVRKGILLDSPEILKLAVDRAAEEIDFLDEGLQKDGSFYQHGHRLYSLGYGRPFVEKTADLMLLLGDSEYQFSEEKMSVLLYHVLDGILYMTHKGGADYAASGREYVRPGALRLGNVERALRKLLRIEKMPRKEEIRAFADAIAEQKPCVSGVKYFPDSAFTVGHYGDVYISFKGTNATLWEAEIINGEAVLGYNLSYGTHTTVMTDGDEYETIAPIWDYARIPGTTAPDETDAQFMARPDWSKRYLTGGAFGGRAFDGKNAVIYESLTHEGISLTVCAFFTAGGVVILGNGLKDAQNRPLTTTVEQCHLKDGYTFDGKVLTHGGAIYESLYTDAVLVPEVSHREGKLNRVALLAADKTVSGDVLTVTLKKPAGCDSYAYRIAPKEAIGEKFSVIRNDGKIQAIGLPDGGIMAHFYENGTLDLGKSTVEGRAGDDIFVPGT